MRVREKWRKVLCAVLGLLICISLLPFAASAEEAETGTNEIKDYVLLLDCSGTMKRYDPYRLCAAACKQFLDQVPLENTRVSIIAFGYPGGEAYQMEVDKNKEMLKYVHLVTPLQETATVKNTKGIKNTINEVTDISGGVTPVGIATLAAVDHLEKNGSTDKNAAIILISDGGIATGASTAGYDVEYVDIAVERANAHEWKIFTIQMNDRGAFGDNSTESVRMRTMAEKTGVGDFGYVNVKDFSEGSLDINIAIAQIITYMSGNERVPEPIFMNLPAEETLTVGDLASECNITLLGSCIKTVTLTYPDGTPRVITGNVDEARLITSWEENSRNIKLIVPDAGDYKIKVEGENTGEEAAILFSYLVMDPSLEMVSTPVVEVGKIFSKDESITFDAHFTYHDIDILNNKYYTEHPAELRIISSSGSPETFQMKATPDGYSHTLSMHDAGNGGAYTAQIWIADSRFTGGGEFSNLIHFKTENLLPSVTNSKIPSLKGYIGKGFDTVDLSEHLSNPDNDPLEYRLSCTSDRNVTFEYTIENDYLNIQCGMVPGEYEMELSFKDYEMTEYLVFDSFKLEVSERPIESIAIPDVEVWVDSFSFQDAGNDSAQVNLLDYFNDPDGLPLTFSSVTGADGFVNVNQKENVLDITPLLQGETVLRFTVNDTFNTIEGQIKVNVISGKSLFWAENWIWFLLGAIALIFILIVLLVLIKTTRVKGVYSVDVYNGCSSLRVEEINIGSATTPGRKKKKFTLVDLLQELQYVADLSGDMVNEIKNYRGMSNIVLQGVTFGTGCKVKNLPKEHANCSCNGIPVKGSGKIGRFGSLEVKKQGDDGSEIVFVLRHLR